MAANEAQRFLNSLALFANFSEASRVSRHIAIPQNWYVFLTDVQQSTQAVSEGRYREVNLAGASSIIAVLNSCEGFEIPYSFGGDGAVFLVPDVFEKKVSEQLLACQQISETGFNLNLRVARIPVADLNTAGFKISLARYQMSSQFVQSVFSGPGLSAAEKWMRDPDKKYLLARNQEAKGNLKGLECRWNPLQSQHGIFISLIVQSQAASIEKTEATYQNILKIIESIYGDKNPVAFSSLKLSLRFRTYLREAKALGKKRLHALATWAVTSAASFLWKNLYRAYGRKYKQELITHTDFRKFDGMLRMVLDGTHEQSVLLEKKLEAIANAGEITYGLHRSSTALLTCFIFDRSQGKHLHLIDGGDGGYTLAAKSMKQQLAKIPKAA